MPKAPSSTPMVSIQRPCYAMASTDGQSADITMYGQIVDTQPTDWWTGEPIPGQYIIESEFLSDLQQVEHCSEITIRMDSVGGDAGVSILIHNRLRELAAKGTMERAAELLRLEQLAEELQARKGHETDLYCGRRGHVRRQPYHVRLRYRQGQPIQPRDDSQVLVAHLGQLQRR